MHFFKAFRLALLISFLLNFSLGAQDIFNAVRTGTPDQIKEMINSNPEIVNSKDNRNSTPLHFTADRGHIPIAQLLLDKGADMHATDVDGDIPLHWAAFRGHVEMCKLLVAKGSDINFKNKDQKTELLIL